MIVKIKVNKYKMSIKKSRKVNSRQKLIPRVRGNSYSKNKKLKYK